MYRKKTYGSEECVLLLQLKFLSEIYAYGLGVPVDIRKAMKFWKQLPNDPRVLENKKNFKRTLFGWKRKE